MTLGERAARLIERFTPAILVAAAAGTLVAGYAARGLRFEHAQEKYEPPSSDSVVRSIEQFRALFGSRVLLVAALKFPRAIDGAELGLVRQAAARVRAVPTVSGVTSVADLRRIAWRSSGVRAERVLPDDAFDAGDLRRLRELVQRTPLYRRGFVSSDWRTAALLVELDRQEGAGRGARQAEAALAVERALRQLSAGRYAVHLTGTPLLNRALQDAARRDVLRFAWLTVLFVAGVLLLLFRRWRPVVLAGLTSGVALTGAVGILAASGTPMSASLTMLVPLTLVLSVAFAVHYLAHSYARDAPADPEARFRRMMRLVFPPSILTGLTTAAGFLALAVSRLASVRETGLFLAVAVLVSMAAASLVLPALLRTRLARGGAASGMAGLPGRLAHGLSVVVTRRARAIIAAAAVLALLGIVGITRVRFDANPLRFFPADHPLRRSTEIIDAQLGGSLPLEIVVRRPRSDLDGLVPAMLRVEARLRALDAIGFVGSAADVLDMAEAARPRILPRFYDTATGRFPADAWSELASGTELREYVHQDTAAVTLRIAARVRINDAEALGDLVRTIDGIVAAESLAGATVTGVAPLLLRTQHYMVTSQISSFLLAFGVMLVLLLPVVRNLRLGAIAACANLLPLVLVLGVMGWLGVAMDIASIMIASIALGIIVDDTIHFLYHYRAGRGEALPVGAAVERAYRRVGVPMVVTSIVLIGGFLVLTPSTFQPTRVFGGLAALTIASAFVADLLLLPAMLVALSRTSHAHDDARAGA